jgi:molybdate transport system substrate-binding protein
MKQFFLATVLVAGLATSASADDIIFLSANALESSVRELILPFEKTSGHTVKVSFGNVSNNAERVRKGDSVDLAITSPQLRADLQAEGKIAAEPNVVIAKVGFGVFVKKGAQKPDISSVDAFKRAVVGAKSIAVGDPQKGSPVGAYILPLFDRLEIGEQVKPKLQLSGGGAQTFESVVKGEAELGFSLTSEIAANPDVELVALLPEQIQNFIVLTVVLPVQAKAPDAAKAFVAFLKTQDARRVMMARGLQPGG